MPIGVTPLKGVCAAMLSLPPPPFDWGTVASCAGDSSATLVERRKLGGLYTRAACAVTRIGKDVVYKQKLIH